MNEKQTKEMLDALEALMKALDEYDSFRDQYTGLPDEYWHSMNKD